MLIGDGTKNSTYKQTQPSHLCPPSLRILKTFRQKEKQHAM